MNIKRHTHTSPRVLKNTLLLLLAISTLSLASIVQAAPTPGKSAPRATGASAASLNIKDAPDDPKSKSGDIVELPRYVVTDSRILPPPESWRYATLPGFEILASTYDITTNKFLKDFQQLQTAIGIVWPALLDKKASVPTLIILCGRMGAFSPFVPDSKDSSVFITPTSLFVEDKERGAIVIDFTMQQLFETSGALANNDPYQQFYRQYARFLMHRANNNKPIPPWLEEGLSRLFNTLDFNKNYIQFARIDDGFKNSGGGSGAGSMAGTSLDVTNDAPANTAFSSLDANGNPNIDPDSDQSSPALDPFGGDINMQDPLGQGSPTRGTNNLGLGSAGGGRGSRARGESFGYIMPFAEMFNPDPATTSPSAWGAQCYAFVHMCIYGLEHKYQKGFLDFAQRAFKGPVTEDDFKACFGRTYKQMELTLRGYTQGVEHKYIYVHDEHGNPVVADAKPLTLREATQAEVGRIKGETLRLAGHPDQSREALIVPYIRKESDPALLASLGLLESTENHADRARKFLEAAAKANVVRPRAYVELARLRLADALAAPGAPDGKLSAAQTANVLDPLFTARSQPPWMEDVYTLIGETWLSSAATPTPANLEVLLEGVARFPRSAPVVYNAAALYSKHGTPDTASALIQFGLKFFTDSQSRKKFEALRKK